MHSVLKICTSHGVNRGLRLPRNSLLCSGTHIYVYPRHASLLAGIITSQLKRVWHPAIHTQTQWPHQAFLDFYSVMLRVKNNAPAGWGNASCVWAPHQMPRLHHQHTAGPDRRPALFQISRGWAHGMSHRRHPAPTITEFCWTGMFSNVRFKLQAGSGKPY